MSVQPATVNFRVYKGATFSETVTLKDSAGVPINLTGYTALGHARRDVSDALPLLVFDTTDATCVLGGVLGTIQLKCAAADTAELDVDWDGEMWVYDLLLTSPSSVDKTLQGALILQPSVTRA